MRNYTPEEQKYIDFMYDIDNEYNCDNCPENIGHDGHEANGNPCGQQNCWVTLHCERQCLAAMP